jgi:hypothetical protein
MALKFAKFPGKLRTLELKGAKRRRLEGRLGDEKEQVRSIT